MDETERGKTKCLKCKKWYDYQKFIGHECLILHGRPISSAHASIHNNHPCNDLQCNFCGLQMENPKLLEIHMRSCRLRNMQQICKLCRSPIRLQNGQQYCANCSSERSQEYDLRMKATTQTKDRVLSRTVAPEQNIENDDFATVNCTGDSSSLIHSKKRIPPLSDSQKQKAVKLKMKTRELHLSLDKIQRNAWKNTVQKKDFKVASSEVPFEKLKNNSQKHNSKTSRQTDEKKRQTSKKNDCLPGKSNPARKDVRLQLLLNSVLENDCGMLLQSSSANKIDHFYKCCRCGKRFKSIKSGSIHYSNCNSNKFLNNEVDVGDIRWVCTICHSPFLDAKKLLNHVKGCNKKYDTICEKRCNKCNFRCYSSLSFQKHDCAKELENMKTCSVRLNAVKINSGVDRVVMHECEFCGEIFDEQLTEQHFHSHHPGEGSSGNFKQYLVNLNPGPSRETVVVKTEPVSPVHEFVGNFESDFEGTGHYSHIHSLHSSNTMPPPPAPQSSVSLTNHQSTSAQTEEPSTSLHSASENARIINEKICKCGNRNVGDDVKPCLECLSNLDLTNFSKAFNVIPFKLAKIKQESSEDSGVMNSDMQADGSLAASSTQIGKEMGLDQWPNQRLVSYFLTDLHSLTPPSSHNGASPPSTPTALMQSLPAEPCSASDVSIGSLNDDMCITAELDGPNSSSVDLVHYINDDYSPVMPLISDISTPMDNCEIMHLTDVDDFNTVDSWAVVSSEGSTTIDRYICSKCIHFSCPDQSSIIKHLYENHDKKNQYIAMYLVEPVSGVCNE